jgi:dTDP-4-amino-4,6-dideoxygalactose transaminase
MEAAVVNVMRSGRIAAGEYVAQFERGLERLLQQANIVTTVDMTSAIQLALKLSGVRAGDDVLTSAFACMATNSAIGALGARPVWVDMKKDTAHIDVADFEAAITRKTRAAILYHLSGYPGPAPEIAGICAARGIKLIEDCDNALLASIGGKTVGSFGDFSIYSFYPNRQINTTEGGALACRTEEDAQKARKLRRFGIDPQTFRDANGEINAASDIPELGMAATLNNLCSALGVTQLESVSSRIEAARKNAASLRQRLAKVRGIHVLLPLEGADPAYWTLLILARDRNRILASLKANGVQASKLHFRNDSYSGFLKCLRPLPNTDVFQESVIALPCGWWLGTDDVDYMVDVIADAACELK